MTDILDELVTKGVRAETIDIIKRALQDAEALAKRRKADRDRQYHVNRGHVRSREVTLGHVTTTQPIENQQSGHVTKKPLSLSLEEENKKTSKKERKEVRRKPNLIPLPDDWQPKGPQRDPTEADEFRDKARAKGWLYANWDAAYRNYQKHPEFNHRNRNGGHQLPVEQDELDRQRQAYFAMQERQREVVKRMKAQGATRDEIKEACWSKAVTGEFGGDQPTDLRRESGMARAIETVAGQLAFPQSRRG